MFVDSHDALCYFLRRLMVELLLPQAPICRKLKEDTDMVEKAKELIPDFIRDRVKNISEPLAKAENAIERARVKVAEKAGALDTTDVKKVFDEVRRQLQKARTEVETLVNEGMGRTLQALNLPSRDEVDVIKADVAKLSKDVKSLAGGAKPAAPKKAAPKKAAPKKAAPKKAAKKAKK